MIIYQFEQYIALYKHNKHNNNEQGHKHIHLCLLGETAKNWWILGHSLYAPEVRKSVWRYSQARGHTCWKIWWYPTAHTTHHHPSPTLNPPTVICWFYTNGKGSREISSPAAFNFFLFFPKDCSPIAPFRVKCFIFSTYDGRNPPSDNPWNATH